MKDGLFEKLRKYLTEEEMQKVLSKMGKDIKVIVTRDPFEFEKRTRRYSEILNHSWAGTKESKVEPDVLVGDYTPGLYSIYEYSANGNVNQPDIEEEMSDFTLTSVQVAKIRSTYESSFLGDNYSDYDADHSEVIIYIPEERENDGPKTFKAMVLDKKRDSFYKRIKQQVGDSLSETDIRAIVDRYDLEEVEIPEVFVTSSPEEFDKYAKTYTDDTEHSSAGRDFVERTTEVIEGDYVSGYSNKYEYYDNGNLTEQTESDTVSDFDLRTTQIALTSRICNLTLSEPNEYSKTNVVVVYIPDEKRLPEGITTYKERVLAQKTQNLFDLIKTEVGAGLTDEQIKDIVSIYDLENKEFPNVVATTEPDTYDLLTRELSKELVHSWAGKDCFYRNTQSIIGDCKPGNESSYQYSDNGNIGDEEFSKTETEFTLRKLQVSFLEDIKEDTLSDFHEYKVDNSIIIYIPNEKELPDVKMYSDFRKLPLYKSVLLLGTEIDEVATPELTAQVTSDLVNMAIVQKEKDEAAEELE